MIGTQPRPWTGLLLVGLVVVVVGACVGGVGTSPVVQGSPAVTPTAGSTAPSSGPVGLDWSGFVDTRDYMLERTLPDEVGGVPLVKWSVNSLGMRWLGGRASTTIEFMPGQGFISYAMARPPEGVDSGEPAIEAYWTGAATEVDLADAYARHLEAFSTGPCVQVVSHGQKAVRCTQPGWFGPGESLWLHAHGGTLWVVHDDPSMLSGLPE